MRAESSERVLHEPEVFGSPDELQIAIQSTLAALADVDTYFQSELSALSDWPGPESIKARIARELEEHHRTDRAPYLQHLGVLHRRMMALIGFNTLH